MANLAEFIFEIFWFLCWSSDAENPPLSFPPVGVSGVVVDCIFTGPSDVEDPSLGVAVDCISPGASDVEDPSLGVAVDCIPPGASDVEDPSLGVAVDCIPPGSLVDVERAVIIEGGR